MRRVIILLFLFSLSGVMYAQQMTDEQVIEYLKEAKRMGKPQQEIASELTKKGVTRRQMLRIKDKYDNEGSRGTVQSVDKVSDQESPDRSRAENMEEEDQYTSVEELEDRTKGADRTQQVFGHDLFTNRNLTFEPNTNIATPENYRLGPGDEVIVDIWGASETTIRQTISPEGSIMINKLGPVYLNGKTVKEANDYLKQQFAKIYSGVSGEEPSTEFKLTLGQIRTIQVDIMGEVSVPGTYRLSAFSSVFHALYRAGGVNPIGSLRSIKVVRNGNVFIVLDVYDFLMKGKLNDDVRLEDGDVILVEPYQSLVQITGKVKRPMLYELKASENLTSLLEYAGGFMGDAYKDCVRVIRKSGREHQIFNVDEMDFSVFRMDDGDMVTVDSVLARFENRVEVRGAVYREGMYQLDGVVNTVKALIEKADGLRGDAFLNRAIIDREREDLTHEMIQVDIQGMLNGTAADIPLQKNDILYIPSIHDLQEEQTLTIHGQVANPGVFVYAENMTVEDLILQAGGLLESASTTKIEVARRVKAPKSMEFTSTVGQNYTFDLKDELAVAEVGADFHLQPFDEVYIRKSPAYHQQQNVMVDGEVLFSGTYAMTRKNERLSDLVAKAGGVTPDAYVKGARLTRKMSEEELRRRADMQRMAQMGAGDSIDVSKLDLSDVYTVGIDLEKALANPGTDYDLVLREGDVLFIPEYVNTVRINGAVMYPNTVLYKPGEDYRFYINQAGGFGNDARKRRAYAIYMNGTVSRLKKGNKHAIEPGCEIVVPTKDAKKKMTTGEMISLGTTTASLAAVIASVINLFK